MQGEADSEPDVRGDRPLILYGIRHREADPMPEGGGRRRDRPHHQIRAGHVHGATGARGIIGLIGFDDSIVTVRHRTKIIIAQGGCGGHKQDGKNGTAGARD